MLNQQVREHRDSDDQPRNQQWTLKDPMGDIE